MILRALVARALPGLPSDQLIEAIGNLEQRDALRWVRDAALALVDSQLPDPRARAAFEHPLAAAAFPYVLANAYRTGNAGEFGPWIDDYARRRPWRVLGALVAAALPRSHPPAPVELDGIQAAMESALKASPQPRGLFVTTVTDARTNALTQPVVDACRAVGLGVTWLRLSPAIPSNDPLDVDLPGRLALDSAGTEQEASELLAHLQPAAASDTAQAVFRRLSSIVPEWAAGRRLGRAAIAAGATFTFVIPDKAPFARGITGVMGEHGAATLSYMASIELGAPAIARFAVDRLFVPSATIADGFVRCGVDRDRLTEVGSTEADRVMQAARPGPRLASGGEVRLLFLTKWPENAIDNLSVLDATIAACSSWGRACVIRVRPHPKDRERYRSRLGPGVLLDEGAYAECLASADVVVTAMSNSVFHAMAVGLPMVVANVNPKIDLGQRRLFGRSDLPREIRYADTPAGVREQVGRMLADAGSRYVLPPALTHDLFLSLDGRSAGRIAAAITKEVARTREVVSHV